MADDTLSLVEVARNAREQFREITGRTPESVSGVHFDEDYWIVNVETLDVSRIPPTTDILSSYVVQLDGDGQVVEYRRTRRYFRNQVQEEDP